MYFVPSSMLNLEMNIRYYHDLEEKRYLCAQICAYCSKCESVDTSRGLWGHRRNVVISVGMRQIWGNSSKVKLALEQYS